MMRRKILAVLAVTFFVATAFLPMLSASEGSSSNTESKSWVATEYDGIIIEYDLEYQNILWFTFVEGELTSTTATFVITALNYEDPHATCSYPNPTGFEIGKGYGLTLDHPLHSESGIEYEILCTCGSFVGTCKLKCVVSEKTTEIDDEGTVTETNVSKPEVVEEKREGGKVVEQTSKSSVITKSTDVAGVVTESRTDITEQKYFDEGKTTKTVTDSYTSVRVVDASGAVVDESSTTVTSTLTPTEQSNVMKEETTSTTQSGSSVTTTKTKSTITTNGNEKIVESNTSVHTGTGGDPTTIYSKVTTNDNVVKTYSEVTIPKVKTTITDETVTTTQEVKESKTVNKVHTETDYTSKDSSGNVVSKISYKGDSYHSLDNTTVETEGTTTVKDSGNTPLKEIETKTKVTISGNVTKTESIETTVDSKTSQTTSVVKTYILDETRASGVAAVTTILDVSGLTANASTISSETTVQSKEGLTVANVDKAYQHANRAVSEFGITGTVNKYVNLNTLSGKIEEKDVIGSDVINKLNGYSMGFKLTGSDCSVAFDKTIVSQIAGASDVKVSAKLGGDLTSDQRRVIGDNTYINISLKVGDTVISKYNGYCTFTINFNGIAGMNYDLCHVKDDGSRESIPCVFDAYTGVLTGITTHNSVYAVFPEGYVAPEKNDNTMIIVAVIIALIVLLALAYYYDKKRKAKAAASFENAPMPPQQQAPAQQPVNDQAPVQEQPVQQQAAPAETQPVQPEQQQPAQPEQQQPAQPEQQPAQPEQQQPVQPEQQPTNDTQSEWDKQNKPNQ